MEQWLKQIKAGKMRQSLVKEARTKIRHLQEEGNFVNAEAILTIQIEKYASGLQ